MDPHFVEALLSPCRIVGSEMVQSLWAGFGEIVRVSLSNGRSVIVKVVDCPDDYTEGDVSTARKVKSYQIERDFYREVNVKECRVPKLVAARENYLVLEDLDAAGYGERKRIAKSMDEVKPMVAWLASFHREFMGYNNPRLWEQGCYWMLATRPDELRALSKNDPLKKAAAAIDDALRSARYTTLVHGDAKIANFCFSKDDVAVVDFQYVGRGVGVRDLAYLLGSCLDEKLMDAFADALLDYYFEVLGQEPQVETEWRTLWPFCFADFERFYKGWAGTSSTRQNRNGYTRRQIDAALSQLSERRKRS